MENILYLVHTEPDGTLAKLAFEVVQAAVQLSKDLPQSTLTVGLVGEKIDQAAASLNGCGAVKFVGVEGADFGVSRYASDAKALEILCRSVAPTLILAPATPRFSRVLPGVTHRLGGAVETHVSGIQSVGSELKIQRWYYRQRMLATLSRAKRPWFLLVDSGVFPVFQGKPGAVSVEKVAVELPAECKRTQVTGIKAPAADAQTIRPDAKLLFVTGAGWTKKQADGQVHAKEAESLILGFLKKTQASLGSSKSLVDQGSEGEAVLSFLSHLNQVGQTGATPRHPKGLATCCHGEEPHVVGWRFINERRAVNLDPNCGWAQGKADVLYVADAFQVIAKVNELLVQG